ncbi:hypothetical protein TREMEDRAFT_70993 [Tremella mesenterica DSM 1558]|uniref:uncharacterized protein n=1 Tax=Tremella mesenterica (strain ATCC 24925 / CBS 8224 / DSM 1558 / NBRC 9311 / NRRL Y-6157 / RJB 2259-6 / UBC 559-6) TaxID=578456 RepID=UPI0003F48DEB|nr:uncharacterized protein TREMEDRAFT_70993 [Tremella mesenterica DSM 1558]EIW73567.1 hypothetical protein TREMEDRAFT_70993 [Tremella mesenterica DSM 1558]
MYRGAVGRPPPPVRGMDPEFDAHCDSVFQDMDPETTDYAEMKRAIWATWRTAPPSGSSSSHARRHDDEDDELQAALALSIDPADVMTRGNSGNSQHSEPNEDDELQRVLELSKQEVRAPKRQRREDTPEEERRMLQEAMDASLAASKAAKGPYEPAANDVNPSDAFPRKERVSEPSIQSKSVPDTTGSVIRIGGATIDRAQLEKERLARQAARAAASADTSSAVGKPLEASLLSTPAAPTSTGADSATDGRSKLQSLRGNGAGPSNVTAKPVVVTSSSSEAPRSVHPYHQSGPLPRDAAGEYYLNGELRHSALTIGRPTTEPTFSLPQVIGKTSEIKLIILSTFVLDDDWLSGILPDPQKVPTVIVRPHPKEMHSTYNGKVQAQVTGEVFCYPLMLDERGAAHMKYAWIFYKTGRLRVMISTANFVPYDWDWIENTTFVQDFLPRKPTSPAPTTKGEDFVAHFRSLFIHLKVHKALRYLKDQHKAGSDLPPQVSGAFEGLDKYDWSRVSVRLIMSVAGYHHGYDQADKYGMTRLGKVLKDEGLVQSKGERLVAEFQGSSLGQYNIEWYNTFYQLCTGKDVRALVDHPKYKDWPPLKIIFPSLATVEASELGKDGGGTMFCGKAFTANTKHLFHHSESKRGGVLMHTKMLIGTFEPIPRSLGFTSVDCKSGKRKASEMEESPYGGWIYVGSHNFSAAAWGTMNFKEKRLTIRNYELGILFPLPRDKARAMADIVAPYKRPARQYSSNDIPWDQHANHDS